MVFAFLKLIFLIQLISINVLAIDWFNLTSIINNIPSVNTVVDAFSQISKGNFNPYVSGKLKSRLENFRNVMKNGKGNVSTLDPFQLEEFQINIEDYYKNFTGELREFHVEGLSDYEVLHTNFDALNFQLSVDFIWKKISGNTTYTVNGTVLEEWPVFGSGNLSFVMENFRFASKIQLKLIQLLEEDWSLNLADPKILLGKIKITDLENKKFSSENLKTNVTGLLNSMKISQSASRFINDEGLEFLKIYKKQITDLIHEVIMNIGNPILSGYTLLDLSNLTD